MKSSIPIFAIEREIGLESAIVNNNSIAYISPLVVSSTELHRAIANLDAYKSAIGNTTDFDLYPIYSILATVGWNKNDDIFDKKEIWMARATPADKPFNHSHIPSKIIGHITGSIVVDENLVPISDSIVFDDLPAKFHILTSAVVYKHINSKDKNLEVEAAELIEGISNGDWFVSMECLFTSFDYGLTTASGEQQIITRNEKTAFLTKHLKVYEGCGEYNGCKLGRVLRHITFSGKGLVKNPANYDSVIINDAKQFIGVLGIERQVNAIGESKMSDELLKEQIKTLQEQLAIANHKLEELGAQQIQATLTAKDAEITKITNTVAEQTKKIEELTASYNNAIKVKEDVDKVNAEISTKLIETTKQLDTIKAEAQKTSRISTLVDKGVEKAIAKSIVNKFATTCDETFSEIVAMQAELVLAKKNVKCNGGDCQTDDNEDEDEDEDEEKDEDENELINDDENDDDEDPNGEAVAIGADVAGAKADADCAMSVQDENKNGEIISALASFFDQTLNYGRNQETK